MTPPTVPGAPTAVPAATRPAATRPAAKRSTAFQPPWRDRHCRLVPIKAWVLPALCVPGIVLSYWWVTGALGGRPVIEMIHGTGLWMVRLMMISLAITPARAIFDWPKLLLVRRMVGVAALAYGLAHLSLYIVDENYRLPTVASEIIHRFYLTIGFIALVGLSVLGATSTDAAVRRLGKRWKQLHRTIYAIAILALLHYFIQSKAIVSEAVTFAGFFTWLMAWRLVPAPWQRKLVTLAALSLLAALATAWIEFGWYALTTGINPWRVIAANETIRFGLRPAHWVAVTGLAVTLLAATLRLWRSLASTPQRKARALP
jgi:methionine sulfoxide reductase heme-binding subunit